MPQFLQTGSNNSACFMGLLGDLSLIYGTCFHAVSGIKLAALIIWASDHNGDSDPWTGGGPQILIFDGLPDDMFGPWTTRWTAKSCNTSGIFSTLASPSHVPVSSLFSLQNLTPFCSVPIVAPSCPLMNISCSSDNSRYINSVESKVYILESRV